MNQEQWGNAARIVVPLICGLLAANGLTIFGDNGLVLQITAAITAIGSIVWTVMAHTDAAKLQAAAAVDPGVKISVPPVVMAENKSIADLVKNTDVPNVVALKITPGINN